MADEESSPFQYFAVDRSGTGLTVLPGTGEYDPKITKEIDAAIRHLPMVREYCDAIAEQVAQRAGSENFRVFKAGGPQRYRAYVQPFTSLGVHEELADGVLLKAALSMQGKGA